MTVDIIVVGLGNPGESYERNRHNVGFMVLDELGKDADWEESSGTKALYAHITIGKHRVELTKPHTFMNKSGEAVSYAVKKHKCKPEQVIVVHDEVDMPLGSIKVSYNRGTAGHRGVTSIAHALRTKAFTRVRVGVVPTTPSGKMKKPRGEQSVLDHLMGDFKKSEEKVLKGVVARAAFAARAIVTEGRERAMNEYN